MIMLLCTPKGECCFCFLQMEDFWKWSLSFVPVISKFTFRIIFCCTWAFLCKAALCISAEGSIIRFSVLFSWLRQQFKCPDFCHGTCPLPGNVVVYFVCLMSVAVWGWFLLGFGLLFWCAFYSPGLCYGMVYFIFLENALRILFNHLFWKLLICLF